VCLSKLNHSFYVAEHATGIAIHLLGDDQTELASLFAERTGDDYDKFEHCEWHRGTGGAPCSSTARHGSKAPSSNASASAITRRS